MSFFKKHFKWEPGEYELDLTVETDRKETNLTANTYSHCSNLNLRNYGIIATAISMTPGSTGFRQLNQG
ncbi:hypothetical protein PS645_00306 [Pseudomonas fluorescens]|uniref:Uncharacterized protein n=1 Tax=Pseudomonas fluorescens TaxID=294 RepID=A0A5E6PL13_PSEFL|nr:hypothetical protein PS645_00306 [Pseudomonas fluorescens]